MRMWKRDRVHAPRLAATNLRQISKPLRGVAVVCIVIAALAGGGVLLAKPPVDSSLGAGSSGEASGNISQASVPAPDPITIASIMGSVNEQRTTASLAALTDSPKLDAAANSKCSDLVARNYWAHADPNGRMPWHYYTELGYSYRYAGENLAQGYTATAALISGWMNSPEHRDNILNPAFKDTGIALCQRPNSQIIVVQEFGSLH